MHAREQEKVPLQGTRYRYRAGWCTHLGSDGGAVGLAGLVDDEQRAAPRFDLNVIEISEGDQRGGVVLRVGGYDLR